MTSSLRTGGQPLDAPLDGAAGIPKARSTDRSLVCAAAVFAAAVMIHGADHLRRGVDSAGLDVFWLGTAAIVVEVGVVVLICQRHRLAPLAAATAGSSLAAGYIAVHFLPARDWFSDSFTSATSVSLLSWVAAGLEVAAAVALGLTGLIALRRRGGLASAAMPHPQQQTLRQGLLHPVALVMVIGNAAVLAIALIQL